MIGLVGALAGGGFRPGRAGGPVDWAYEGGGLGLPPTERAAIAAVGGTAAEGVAAGVGREEGLVRGAGVDRELNDDSAGRRPEMVS